MFSDYNPYNRMTPQSANNYRESLGSVLESVKGKYFRSTTEKPYSMYPTSDRDVYVPVFTDHFINTTRATLADSLYVGQFNNKELDLYYSYGEYLAYLLGNPTDPFTEDSELLLVLETLSTCMSDEVQCLTPTYLNRCFDVHHTWDSCTDMDSEATRLTVILSQASYDNLPSIDVRTIYIISEDGGTTVTKILQGGIVLGEANG